MELDWAKLDPGPDVLNLGFCNPTFLTNKADAFRDLHCQCKCHFIAASETSATLPVQVMTRRKLFSFHNGSSFPSRKG